MADVPPADPGHAPKKPLWKRTWFVVSAIVVALLLVVGVSTAAAEVATIEAQETAATHTPAPPAPPPPLVTPSESPSEPAAPEPTPEPTLEPTAQPTAEPTTEPSPQPTIGPSPEPTVEPTIEPTIEPTTPPDVNPARFKTSAGKHLNDFEKGLNAMSAAMSEFNNPLVVANSAKLAVNAKQLKALEAPENISEEWKTANAALTGLVAEMKAAVKAQDYPTLTHLVEAGHLQVAAMRDIVARAE